MTPLELICLTQAYLADPGSMLRHPYDSSDVCGLLGAGYLKVAPGSEPMHAITEKGRVYVKAALALPLPVKTWVMPTDPMQRWAG